MAETWGAIRREEDVLSGTMQGKDGILGYDRNRLYYIPLIWRPEGRADAFEGNTIITAPRLELSLHNGINPETGFILNNVNVFIDTNGLINAMVSFCVCGECPKLGLKAERGIHRAVT